RAGPLRGDQRRGRTVAAVGHGRRTDDGGSHRRGAVEAPPAAAGTRVPAGGTVHRAVATTGHRRPHHGALLRGGSARRTVAAVAVGHRSDRAPRSRTRGAAHRRPAASVLRERGRMVHCWCYWCCPGYLPVTGIKLASSAMMSVGLSTMPTMSLDTVSSPEPLRTDDVAPTGQSDDAAWSSIHGDAEYRWHLLHHDLQKLAGWMAIRGRESRPLVCMELEDSAPEELQELAARVNDFRFDDLLDPAAHRADPLDEVVEFVRGCDEREVAILRDRFVGWDRRTLDEIGAEFGVTRERIRQVEKQLLARFREVTDSSTAVSRLLASMRIDIDPVCRLDRLAAKNPVLEQRVPRLDVPLWRVLDQLDDAFVVDDGWAAMPSIEAAKARTRTLFNEVADEHGVALSEDFATVTELQAQERDAWMRYCEFRAEGQHLFAPVRSVTDLAVQILSAAGEPLAFGDLFSRMAVDRNPRGIRDRCGQDDRIARVARGTYGLAEWGGDEYVSIRDMIAQRVDENGAYPLQDLIDEITPRGVAAS